VPPAGTSVKVTLFPGLIFPLAGFIVNVSVGAGTAVTVIVVAPGIAAVWVTPEDGEDSA